MGNFTSLVLLRLGRTEAVYQLPGSTEKSKMPALPPNPYGKCFPLFKLVLGLSLVLLL